MVAVVSIKDVARLSGVSISTVSRALNGYSDVKDPVKVPEIFHQKGKKMLPLLYRVLQVTALWMSLQEMF